LGGACLPRDWPLTSAELAERRAAADRSVVSNLERFVSRKWSDPTAEALRAAEARLRAAEGGRGGGAAGDEEAAAARAEAESLRQQLLDQREEGRSKAGEIVRFCAPGLLSGECEADDEELCASDARHSLQCMPPLWGRIGFAPSGVRNDGKVLAPEAAAAGDVIEPSARGIPARRRLEVGYNRANSASNRFKCEMEETDSSGVCWERCSLAATTPPTCTRLAAASLNFWLDKQYGQNTGFVSYVLDDAAKCLERSGIAHRHYGNCWAFTACARKVMQEYLCREVASACCGRFAKSDAGLDDDMTVVHDDDAGRCFDLSTGRLLGTTGFMTQEACGEVGTRAGTAFRWMPLGMSTEYVETH
jgi:hypothetical protein